MTNLEKFEDEIKVMIYTGSNFAVEKDGNGEPVRCRDVNINCSNCRFYPSCDCSKARKEWLKEEYIEPNDNIKLPKDIKTGTPIWVKEEHSLYWLIRIFNRYYNGGVECFYDGAYGTNVCNVWKYAKPFVEGVNPNED